MRANPTEPRACPAPAFSARRCTMVDSQALKPGMKVRKRSPDEEDAASLESVGVDAAEPTQEGASGAIASPRGAEGQQARPRVHEGTTASQWSTPAPRGSHARAGMPSVDDFAALLGDAPMELRRVQVGEEVTAPVVGLTPQGAFVDLGGKTEGFIEAHELQRDGEWTVAIGDTVRAWVVKTRGGVVQLSHSLDRDGGAGYDVLEAAHAEGMPVEGRVLEVNKGGYVVEVAGVRAFCPFSQIDLGTTEDPQVHVGALYPFSIERVEGSGRDVLVSRAAWLRRERERSVAALMERLQEGDSVEGVVTRLASFGAFVELAPGVEGLAHVSELGHTRVEDPAAVLRVGERVRVKVLRLEPGERADRPRISLSLRALQEDPWDAWLATVAVGGTVRGEVVRLESFGAFVELAPGVEGLVHISELAQGRRIRHPKEAVEVGQHVELQIQELDPLRRRVGLSLRAMMEDSWGQAAAILRPGQIVQGEVSSVQPFGVFVDLPQGITALLPASEVGEDSARRPLQRRFPVGSVVEARVLSVEAARRRLTLTCRPESESDADTQGWRESTPEAGMGTLGDLLRASRKGG